MATEFVKKAIREGNLEILEADNLHDLDIELNEGLGEDGYTPLHWACYYGRTEVRKRLLNFGVNPF